MTNERRRIRFWTEQMERAHHVYLTIHIAGRRHDTRFAGQYYL